MSNWDPEKDVQIKDFGIFLPADAESGQKELCADVRQYDGGTVKLCIHRRWMNEKKGEQSRRIASFTLPEAEALSDLLVQLAGDGDLTEDESE